MLAFDGTGMVLATKWLEEGASLGRRFSAGTMRLTATQLAMLLEGLAEWSRVGRKADETTDESCLKRLILLATQSIFV